MVKPSRALAASDPCCPPDCCPPDAVPPGCC